jgi:2-polyprenyl-3-methyl-5-hydroxy-6-metoxy-1,4-benzoquinol methylase
MNTNFNKILELVYSKSPLQKKKLEKYLSKKDKLFFESAENFAQEYSSYLKSQGMSIEYAVDAYLKMCKDMIKSQISFMKTGKYPMLDAEKAFEQVYNDRNEMTSFMIGLGISQYLWSSHYEMYQFLRKNLISERENIKNYLEIGPGHGIFLKDAITILGEQNNFLAVDISEASINITNSILKHLLKRNPVEYITMDILKFDSDRKMDFITMGEVLEHVNYPDKLLTKFSNMLSENGRGFISTCVNCPTIDHVCHFKCVAEIRELLTRNGLVIMEELVLPVEDLPMEEIIEKKITINYCAIVSKKS